MKTIYSIIENNHLADWNLKPSGGDMTWRSRPYSDTLPQDHAQIRQIDFRLTYAASKKRNEI